MKRNKTTRRPKTAPKKKSSSASKPARAGAPSRARKSSKDSLAAHFKKSKTENFLQNLQTNNSMIEYFTNLRVLNPAAQLGTSLNEPRREGGFVRLAHARDEFTAPVITKGKSIVAKTKSAKPRRKK